MILLLWELASYYFLIRIFCLIIPYSNLPGIPADGIEGYSLIIDEIKFEYIYFDLYLEND